MHGKAQDQGTTERNTQLPDVAHLQVGVVDGGTTPQVVQELHLRQPGKVLWIVQGGEQEVGEGAGTATVPGMR